MHFLIGFLVAVGLFAGLRLVRRRRWARGKCGPGSWERWIDWRVDAALDRLAATDTQRSRVKDLQRRLLEKSQDLFRERRKRREDLVAQLLSEELDTENLRNVVEARAEAVKRFGHDLVNAAAELKEVLSPEQLRQVQEHLRRRQAAWGRC